MEAVEPRRRLAGRYVLEEPIASGGMATVWRAQDEVLARAVAVKILREDLAADPSFLERFRMEAVGAARLTHPFIVSVYDTGVDDGVCYIVMEHFGPHTLRDVLRRDRPIDPQRAVDLITPVLTALGVAHADGLVHRDVKPANILVGPDDRVKVTDFGIAKAVFGTKDLTTTGAVLGTVAYLSPEQVRSEDLDARSDVYSVGVVLYEMLTGNVPFTAENDVAAAMLRVTADPRPPRDLRPAIPRELEGVVLRAMARHPGQRYPSAEAMRRALEPFGSDVGGPSTRPVAVERPEQVVGRAPSGSAFRSWMLVPVLVLLVGAVVIAGGLLFGALEFGGTFGVRLAPEQARGGEGQARAVPIASALAFDPEGDGSESDSEASLAIDPSGETSWTTERYTTAAFGNLKDGVGLWLDLGKSEDVSRVVVASPLTGWTFQIRPGQSPEAASGPLRAAGGSATFAIGSNGKASVSFEPVRTRGILIWVTGLAPDEGRYAAAISDVTIAGAAA